MDGDDVEVHAMPLQRAMKLLCPPTVWIGTAAAPHLLSQGIKPLRYPGLVFARRW